MQKIKTYIKKYPYYFSIAVAILVLGTVAIIKMSGDEVTPEEALTRKVETLSVSEYAEGALGVAYPTASGDSFVVRSEASGRVNVVAKSGEKITAGQVVAELDNASERAALTQAQGSYEAALAGAAQSDVSLADAEAALTGSKQDAINTNKAALAAWTSVLYNTVDQLFLNPRVNPPGVKISAEGQATSLNDERVAMNTLLSDWQKKVTTLSNNSDTASLTRELDQALAHVDRLGRMVDTFNTLIQKQGSNDVYTDSELSRLSSEFATAKTSLNTQHSALTSAKNSLLRAEETVNSASIGSTGGQVSSANASIKQALGAYQAVKANYDRTIVRAPFDGTISSLNITVGDIIGVGTDVAIIVPEAGAVTTRWWELPLAAVKYTPDNAYVFVVNAEGALEAIPVETGLVTSNSIKVTGLKGDENVVKDVRGLKAGDKVEVN